ncbi:RNA methyltransferase [Telmatospirillum sp. J64-1]|uniref:RNA methyltransferase n=1 Tax=Telmatospirillum sp. J64-1 TaxID=2502183 RepID=UPI00115DCDE8|nr:RNA methyltransferase [Telmatospirillum sp. J64-1]
MRGFYGIGVEGISKIANVGSLFRTAHAFQASFVFTIGTDYSRMQGKRTDTSDTTRQLPFYAFPDATALMLPQGCKLVGVELTDEAIDLPVFRHPYNAAYVLGRERGSLTPALQERCDFMVKIPTRFCLNVALAGALVMYDRLLSFGRFPDRAAKPGEKPEARQHTFGTPIFRNPENLARFRMEPPEE